LVLVVTPAFGQLLSDRTGLVNRLDVETGGHTFEVETVSNFDIVNYEFDKDEKQLTIFINSGLENNLGELLIPQTLLSGNFTFYLNGMEYNPKIKSNDKISFITLNFTGIGNNRIDVIATETLNGLEDKLEIDDSTESPSNGGGCLIATATYGTELASQVQMLREIRDQKLMKSEYGQSFLNSFNKFYYSFSPIVADWEREYPLFKESVKLFLTPMISSLFVLNYAQMDNNSQILGVGISIISLNIGMYFALPAILIMRLKR
jgi:hypothetical protein